MFKGLVPIPHIFALVAAFSHLRRFRFCLVLCVRWFRVVSLISRSVLVYFVRRFRFSVLLFARAIQRPRF